MPLSPLQTSFLRDRKWIEEDIHQQNIHHIVGVDEAGRGPLAGPVVAAAVCLSQNSVLEHLDDSKRVRATQRQQLFSQIQESALAIGVGLICSAEIDQMNILQATLKAMKLALDSLRKKITFQPESILVDGNQAFPYDLPIKTIVKGDQLSQNIAAASIIAKVTRDQIMASYDQLYPQYGFLSHKGYPSAQHRKILHEIGPCPIHRLSFRGVLSEKT